MVDVSGVDEAVHGGVDRGRGAAASVQRVVECGDHFVFALDTWVDVDQRPEPIQTQDGQALLGQRTEVAAGSLDPHQVDVGAGDRVDVGAFGRGVAAGIVGVLGVGTESVGPLDQRADGGVGTRECLGCGCFVGHWSSLR